MVAMRRPSSIDPGQWLLVRSGAVTNCYRRLPIQHRPVAGGRYCAAIPREAAAMFDSYSTVELAVPSDPFEMVEVIAPVMDGSEFRRSSTLVVP